jgi:hypothetical protein
MLQRADIAVWLVAARRRASLHRGWGYHHRARHHSLRATGWLLDDTAVHTPSILPDLTFSVILAAMLIALSAYLVIW